MHGPGVVENLGEGKGGVWMHAGSNGIRQPGEIIFGEGHQFLFQWGKVGRPLLRVGILPGMQFRREAQGPGPAVHALIIEIVLGGVVSRLDGQVGGGCGGGFIFFKKLIYGYFSQEIYTVEFAGERFAYGAAVFKGLWVQSGQIAPRQ